MYRKINIEQLNREQAQEHVRPLADKIIQLTQDQSEHTYTFILSLLTDAFLDGVFYTKYKDE